MSQTPLDAARESVAAGAAFLTGHYGSDEWITRSVNWGSFEISSALRCILGQLYGWYWTGRAALGMDTPTALELGFTSYEWTDEGPELSAPFGDADLQLAWLELAAAHGSDVAAERLPLYRAAA